MSFRHKSSLPASLGAVVETPAALSDRSTSMKETTETESSSSSSSSSSIVEASISLWELEESSAANTAGGCLIQESSAACPLRRDEPPLLGKHHSSDDSFPTDIEQWSLVTILGEGNFGQVWQVARKKDDDDGNSPTYALKVMSKHEIVSDDQVDMVLNEKRILQLLSAENGHPFIVQLCAAWQDDNLIYFLQDFVQGGELYSRMLLPDAFDVSSDTMPLRQALPEDHVQFYITCIADALHYMHNRHRICYRDLKPENVLLQTHGYPVLIDVGAAKQLVEQHQQNTYTMVGTPRYMAPEMIDGSCGHSFGVDHWALAVLAYELLTGDHPFDEWDNSNDARLFAAIAEEEPLPMKEEAVGDVARAWIHALLVKEPTARLGYSVSQTDDDEASPLLQHPWLSHMPLSDLRRQQIVAPWKPAVEDHNDSSQFDDWGHLESVVQPTYARMHSQDAALFDSF